MTHLCNANYVDKNANSNYLKGHTFLSFTQGNNNLAGFEDYFFFFFRLLRTSAMDYGHLILEIKKAVLSVFLLQGLWDLIKRKLHLVTDTSHST